MPRLTIALLSTIWLASCAHLSPGAGVPDTVTLKGGTTYTHEPGEEVKRVNTGMVEIVWRLKK